MLSVSSRFSEAEAADVNQIASRIYLVLGNYASSSAYGSTVSASSSDGSGNYPASGSIDGDRTELNVGAATAADNDVGLSSWRSATAPSVTPQTLTIDFGQSRTINRIKLYHLSSHGLSSYKLESSPDNSAWTLIDKTTDQGGTITTTNELDTLDFTEVTCRYVKLTVADTVVGADKANVVELEIYRKVDISAYVLSASIDRNRDYKLTNPLASSFTINCDNNDRFFSWSHVPTSTETTDGFVNSELRPGMGIIIQYGFSYGGGTPELVTVFNGTVDKLRINPADRTAQISGRDTMKALINQTISSKLKTAEDIGSAIVYTLNLVNISTWETSVDTTSLTVDYFFINNQTGMTVIRDLVEASADAQFYFSESGIATFRYYVNSTPGSHTDSSEADFQAGTVKTNIDTDSAVGQIGRKWFLIDDFADGDLNSNPVWTNRVTAQSDSDTTESDFESGSVLTNIDTVTVPGEISRKWFLIDSFDDITYETNPAWNVFNGSYNSTPPLPTNKWSALTGKLTYSPAISGQQGRAYLSFAAAYGTWETKVQMVTSGTLTGYQEVFFVASNVWNTTGPRGQLSNGYCIRIDKSASRIILQRDDSTVRTTLSTAIQAIDDSQHTLRITRTATGDFDFYWDGAKLDFASPNDTTYTTSVYFGFHAEINGLANPTASFDDIYYSRAVLAPASAYTGSQSIFESRTFDLTADVLTLGSFTATTSAPTGSSLSFFTASSADGITWDSYVAVTNGGLILSTARRYLKYKVLLVCPIDSGTNNANIVTPSVQDVTFEYTTVGWKVVSNALKFAPLTSAITIGIDTPFQAVIGTWRATFQMTVGTASGETARMYFLSTGYDIPNTTYTNGYYVELNQAAGELRLYKISASASRTLLTSVAQAINGAVHSVRVTRTSAGDMNVYWDEVLKLTANDTGFTSNTAFALEVAPNGDQNGSTIIDDIYYSPAIDGTGAVTNVQAVFESQVIDMTASVNSLGIFQATSSLPGGTTVQYYTATSSDNVTYDAYVSATNGGAIASSVKRYIKYKAVLTCPCDALSDGGAALNSNTTTPSVFDVTLNWFIGTGSVKYPTSVSFTFEYSSILLGLAQEYADNLGGDSAIINDVTVQAKPLILSGTNADTQWQGTTQTPPVAISVTAPLSVTMGTTLTYKIVVPSGMDTSLMTGGSPAAGAITFAGGGAGTWTFTRIHPTRPILQITITGTGSITDLRVIGKGFSNSNTNAIQSASDTASIKLNGDRATNISNQYIVNTGIASSIATKIIANFKNATSYVPDAIVRPTFSAQLGDRVTIVDDNTDIDADYVIVGINHTVSADVGGAQAQTALLLLEVLA